MTTLNTKYRDKSVSDDFDLQWHVFVAAVIYVVIFTAGALCGRWVSPLSLGNGWNDVSVYGRYGHISNPPYQVQFMHSSSCPGCNTGLSQR